VNVNDFRVKKIVGMKKAMTKTMTDSLSIPFFMFADEYDVTKLLAMRQRIKKDGNNVTVLPFFVKAVSSALNQFPLVNSWANPETDSEGYIMEYVIKKDHNISVAIDSPDGLTVPNIKNC
jgi:2-oxoisovalerate dehydrogenase E2 component (dihydrolipoyl transacylase)